MTTTESIICVVGPTASGKSDLAQEIALALNGEVVSADSMQIYRGMDIGTGKVLEEERKVKHYGLDIQNPGEPYSAALFQAYARNAFKEIAARGKRVILCGGTGFYIRAALDGYEFPHGEQVGNEVRDYYRRIAEDAGELALWQLLNERDPQSAQIIPPHDTKRVIRAFELIEDGTTYARQREKLKDIPQVYPAIFIGLQVDVDILNKRIDQRVDKMLSSGLIDEVKTLLDEGFREGLCAPQAIGYKEILAYLDGKKSLDEAVQSIKTATHRYAKRQRTWFRKDNRIHWIDANDGNLARVTEEALKIIEHSN
ncbi:MAG: tRNA (adenosine(37)-N6)-dimethylallyltransferase MiaA [Eggerthellaceae bacterium]